MKGAEKVESWLGIQKQREREEFLIQTNIVLLLSVVNQLNYLSPHRTNEQSFFYSCQEYSYDKLVQCMQNHKELTPLTYTLEFRQY